MSLALGLVYKLKSILRKGLSSLESHIWYFQLVLLSEMAMKYWYVPESVFRVRKAGSDAISKHRTHVFEALANDLIELAKEDPRKSIKSEQTIAVIAISHLNFATADVALKSERTSLSQEPGFGWISTFSAEKYL